MENTVISHEQLETIKNWLGSGSINIFGLPFAGKDTHGNKLAALFDAPLLSSGEAFRNSRSLLSAEDQETLDTGGLMPSDLFIRLFTPYFGKDEYANRPIILSSVGRWIGEEQGIIKAAQDSGHPTKAVIYLHLSEEVALKRLKKSQEVGDRTRPEDSEEHLRTRFDEFNNKTLPVIEIYRQMGLLIEVNSDAEKSEVLDNILARLYLRATE